LAQHQDEKCCLNQILNFVKTENHELIKKVVAESIDEYMCAKVSSSAEYFFHEIITSSIDFKINTNHDKLNQDLLTYAGK
jgi:hypothetical protein